MELSKQRIGTFHTATKIWAKAVKVRLRISSYLLVELSEWESDSGEPREKV